MSLQHAKFSMAVNITVADDIIEQHVAVSLEKIAEEIANEVISYAETNKLGYIPAIDFFQNNGGIDKDLLDVTESVSWVLSNTIRNDFRVCLRPVFSNIKFEALQLNAYTMPKVTLHDADLRQKLIKHFMLNKIKINFNATLIQKMIDTEHVGDMAKEITYRRLSEHFNEVEISAFRLFVNA